MVGQSRLKKFIQEEVKPSLIEAVRRGDYKAIGEIIAEAFKPLISSIEEEGKRIEEIRASLEEEGKRIEEIRISLIEEGKRIEELRKSIAELRSSLEAEIRARKGEAGRLEGFIVQIRLAGQLESWCKAFNLFLTSLPREPYRVDAVIEGEELVALVEIAKTGAEADIEQLLEGARIYEQIKGEKPNALVLYIYAERPPEWLVEEAEKHGIIVDNSPKRIARALAKIEEELRRKRAGQK